MDDEQKKRLVELVTKMQKRKKPMQFATFEELEAAGILTKAFRLGWSAKKKS